MTAPSEVAAAREEVERARSHISDTIDEIESRLIAPVNAAKQRLDVIQLVRDHPWPALAIAIGAGVLVSATGADAKAAAIAKQTAIDVGTSAKEKAIDLGTTAAHAARDLPSTTRSAAQNVTHAAGSYFDGLAGSLLLAFIDRLREPAAVSNAPQADASSTAHHPPA